MKTYSVSRGSTLLFAFALLVPLCACSNAPSKSAGRGEVTLALVKQNEYVKTLDSMRGKVVVVDVWGEF
jgi:hypothetical protein